jgi:hypothetical protein
MGTVIVRSKSRVTVGVTNAMFANALKHHPVMAIVETERTHVVFGRGVKRTRRLAVLGEMDTRDKFVAG